MVRPSGAEPRAWSLRARGPSARTGGAARRGAAGRRGAAALHVAAGVALGGALLSFTAAGLDWMPTARVPELGPALAWTDQLQTVETLRARGVHGTLALIRALTLVLLGAIAANLLFLALDRGAALRGEMRLRIALGASPRRAVGWMLDGLPRATAVGVLLGAAAAAPLHRALYATWPAEAESWSGALEPWVVAACGAGLAMVTLLAAAAPALAAGAGRGLARDLSVGRAATAGPFQLLVRRVVARAQFAASLALAATAGLLLRAAPRAEPAPPGAAEPVILSVALPPEEGSARAARLAAALARLPGGAAAATPAAWTGEGPEDVVTSLCRPACAEGGVALPVLYRSARMAAVAGDYFAVVGAGTVEGRVFGEAAGRGAEPEAVISRSAANRLFPGRPAVGQRLVPGVVPIARLERVQPARIIGVVEDVYLPGTPAGPGPVVFLDALQHPPAAASFAVRDSTEAAVLTAAGLRVTAAEPLRSLRRRAAAPARRGAALLAALAAVAVAICGYGLHAVTAAGMAARTREIGVRTALGATPAQIGRLVLGAALRLAATGGILGGLLSLGLAGILRRGVAGVPWLDPVLTTWVAAALGVVALLAAWKPAARAAGADPAEAIRRP